MRLTKLRPFGGFAAETGGSAAVMTAIALGVPVSTTQAITGAIVGVGALRSRGAVNWSVVQQILWAWVLTIPASATLAGVAYLLVRAFGF